MCTINNIHMMYGSTYGVPHRILLFWTIFCPFTPLTTPKIKILKKKEKTSRYIILNLSHKWQLFDVPELWSLIQNFLFVLNHFLPFHHPNNLRIQKFEKMKKSPGDIIILQMCAINDNHMMYGSWDMEHDRQAFLSFWAIFCSFKPLTTQKIKILNLKKWKERYICVP